MTVIQVSLAGPMGPQGVAGPGRVIGPYTLAWNTANAASGVALGTIGDIPADSCVVKVWSETTTAFTYSPAPSTTPEVALYIGATGANSKFVANFSVGPVDENAEVAQSNSTMSSTFVVRTKVDSRLWVVADYNGGTPTAGTLTIYLFIAELQGT